MKLNKQDLSELQELNRIVNAERFKLTQVKGNTALVPKGKEYIKTQEGIVSVLEATRESIVAKKLIGLGFQQGQPVMIDLKTGRIKNKKV